MPRPDFDEGLIGAKRKRREEPDHVQVNAKRHASLTAMYRTCCDLYHKLEDQYVETDQELHKLIGAIRHFETQVYVGCRSSTCTLCGCDFGSVTARAEWAQGFLEKIGLNKKYLEQSQTVQRHKRCLRLLSSRADDLRQKSDRVRDLLSGRLQALSIQGAFTLRESKCSVCKRDLSPKQLEVFHDVLERRLSVITARIATKYSVHKT